MSDDDLCLVCECGSWHHWKVYYADVVKLVCSMCGKDKIIKPMNYARMELQYDYS